MRGCEPVSKYAYILFTHQNENTVLDSLLFFFLVFILVLSHTSAENTSCSFVLLYNILSHGGTFKLFLPSLWLS